MSVIAPVSGSLLPPKSTLVLATQTAIWTPGDFETLAQLVLANSTAGAIQVTIEWNDGTTDWLLAPRSVPANDHVVIEIAARLLTGSTLKATAASAPGIVATVIAAKSGRDIARRG